MRKLFGIDAKGKKLVGVEPRLDPNFIKKIRYKCEDQAIPVNDLKKLFKVTPNVTDLELFGKRLSESAVQDAAKAYAPNLTKVDLSDIRLEPHYIVDVLNLNPNLVDLKIALKGNPIPADFATITRAGQGMRPGGTATTSRLVNLDRELTLFLGRVLKSFAATNLISLLFSTPLFSIQSKPTSMDSTSESSSNSQLVPRTRAAFGRRDLHRCIRCFDWCATCSVSKAEKLYRQVCLLGIGDLVYRRRRWSQFAGEGR